MRITYLVGGFSSTDALILDSLATMVDSVTVIYTRDRPASYPVLEKVRPIWIDVRNFRWVPKKLRWFGYAAKVILAARESRPDVLMAEGIQVHGLLAVLSGIRPILLLPWGSDWAIVAPKSWLTRNLSRFVLRSVDMVQIDCQAGKRRVLELGSPRLRPERVWVFPQGIELEIFRPEPAAGRILRERHGWGDKTVFIMTRTHLPIYGIDLFLKAFSRLAKEDENVRALIVGDGPETEALKRLAHELGLDHSVAFVGRVSRAELVSLLNAADVYVSTSYSDGTSLSLLEAMAVGLPAVVTDVPANLEWIRDGYNGYVAERGNVESIYRALQRMLERRELWGEFGERNRRIAQRKADWRANSRKFLDMFELMLNGTN